ncbi:MAG: glucans biosynthesis glucosyltransferase MdoH [Bradyrhizobiaceae bacterium]|nr:glucans biosynthesis glucosyltransferase MdoH [Bradyrhizobiaceae bacterium]
MSADPSSVELTGAAASIAKNRTPTGTQSKATLAVRRFVVGLLNIATIATFAWWLVSILSRDGFGAVDFLLVAMFLIHAPWVVIGFWNSVIGLAVLHLAREPLHHLIPLVERARTDDPIFVGVAVIMTVRNEDSARAFLRLRTVKASLDATGYGDKFDYFILSDSTQKDVIAAEETEYRRWRKEVPEEGRIVYRRRDRNTGFKAGNVRDFLEHWGAHYDLMVPLDADSLMTGKSIARLVRIMQANPRLGILQSLVVGMPSQSFFARVFQFGMRHGMRSFTAGTAWWHADCGPFWGHNAVVRVAPFKEHCRLPDLPGKPPFGGHILSHDAIEAILMRNAGFEVRVFPEEEDSWEEMPPAMPDFAVRDLRWCQGNLQYLKLIGLPHKAMSRFNIFFALQMFIGVAALILFVMLAAVAAALWPATVAFPAGSALAFYLLWIFMFLTPKFAGIADAMLRSADTYGGKARLLSSAAFEAVFSLLLTSISWLGQAIFMTALLFGRAITWDAQRRDRYRLAWNEAARVFWPHTLFAFVLLVFLALAAPGAIVWFLPFLLGPLLSIPFAVVTSSPELGALAVKLRFCAIPEEFATPPDLAKILPRSGS